MIAELQNAYEELRSECDSIEAGVASIEQQLQASDDPLRRRMLHSDAAALSGRTAQLRARIRALKAKLDEPM